MSELAGKVAIVSGGSRGIGAATAARLAELGATVVVVARRGDALQAVVAEVVGRGGRAEAAPCDITDYAGVVALVEGVIERSGRIDILVNNAGLVEPIARIEDSDPAAWADNVAVTLTGAYHLCRASIPHFRKAGSGVIVNVSSGAAHRPLEGWSAYCAAKAGLYMLTRSIALEEADAGVTVYGFGPGTVDTEMQVAIRASGINPISQLTRSELAPPEVPARVIAWLCTGEAADLAGQELSIRDEALRKRAGLDD